jgi:tetratricopeptide (TPR) repeat protein
MQGSIEEAMGHYKDALRIRPDYPQAHNNLGSILAEQGKLEEAIFHYRQALRLDPNYQKARDNLDVAIRNLNSSGKEEEK